MRKHFRIAILTMLALLIAVGLVYAQPVYIGQTVQPVPFESNPTAQSNSGTSPSGYTMMWDGDLYSSGSITLGSGLGSTAYFTLHTFTTLSPPEWDPEWVEIKMKYEVPSAAMDDKYRIEYSTDGSTWVTLEDYGGLKYPTFSLAIRPWSQVVEPQDGLWSWTDISNLQLRIYCTKGGLGWDTNKKMYIYEAWVTVYPEPLPPISSTTISVQPPAVTRLRPYDYLLGGVQGICFVEIYVNDVADLFGYQLVLYFDTTVLTPYEAWSYYPWTQESVKDLNDGAGYVSMAYIMPPVAVGEAFYGNSPVARIYFIVDAYGGGGGGGAYGGLEGTCDLTISKDPLETILSDSQGISIPFTAHDGWFSGSHYMSYVGSTFPGGDPECTTWHELYPTYCKNWHLTNWEDDPTNPDSELSKSDQIGMTNETGWKYWFHVDDVTITIHWTFKDPDVGEGAAEPLDPVPLPHDFDYAYPGDPTGSYWHQIYPEDQFCRWFMITSWEDTDGSTTFNPSDQFDFEYLDEPGTHWAHLADVTTDILVSQKPIDPEPPEAEFPIGVGLMIAIAPVIPIIYLWRSRKKVVA